MSIRMRCQNHECGKLLQLKNDRAGKRVKCPHCNQVQTAPDAEAPGLDSESQPATSPRDSLPDGVRAQPKSKHRKRRKTSTRGFGFANMVLFGMPLPIFLGVLLLAVGVIAGSIYFVGTRNAKSAAADKQNADWGSNDYDTFMNHLKFQEAERTKPANLGDHSYDNPYPPNWALTFGFTGPKEVKWQGVFQSLDEAKKILSFDLPVSYETAGKLGEHQPGAEYTVAFSPAEGSLAEWKAVPKGQKVRFSGLLGAGGKGRPPVFVFSEGYRKGVVVFDDFGKVHDPLKYVIQINVSDVKLLRFFRDRARKKWPLRGSS